jgi:hypothetical protein
MVLAPAPLHIANGAELVVLFDFEGGGHARNCTGVNGRRPLQITLTTARTRLAHIFEKTGTRRHEVLEGIIETDWWVCEKLAKALHAHWLASSAANGSQSSAARPWGALAETFKMANRRRADLIALCSLNGSAFRKMPPDHMTPKAMAKAVNDHFTKIGEPLNVSDKHIIRNVRK